MPGQETSEAGMVNSSKSEPKMVFLFEISEHESALERMEITSECEEKKGALNHNGY